MYIHVETIERSHAILFYYSRSCLIGTSIMGICGYMGNFINRFLPYKFDLWDVVIVNQGSNFSLPVSSCWPQPSSPSIMSLRVAHRPCSDGKVSRSLPV